MQSALFQRRWRLALPTALALLVNGTGSVHVVTCPAEGSEAYLAKFGPPPLRFAAPVPDNKRFTWFAPVISAASATNDSPSAVTPTSGTNAPASISSSQSNQLLQATSPAPIPVEDFGVSGLSQNSASNLLIFTPQMVAEFLKATLDANSRANTNAAPSGEIPFIPPSPTAHPSSEAIYRSE